MHNWITLLYTWNKHNIVNQVCACWVASVMSKSLWPYGPTRLLCPWDSPGKNTGVGCHALLQGSSWPRDQTHVSRIAGGFFTSWATRKALRALYPLHLAVPCATWWIHPVCSQPVGWYHHPHQSLPRGKLGCCQWFSFLTPSVQPITK